ncbi:uncharacterized protein LOC113466343 [Diaphorina citri]|uniref:Uncharacterized protein LOC113466343 n=1 Tax=Diaphorina citri TaxID=121845 RepID=A0A3Q0ISX0_DIACI|nr:uncharacterized protein LOC113466343 [Diaphorina citri]
MVSAANGAEDFYTTEVNTENSVELRDNRYNQIIHMVSAANGAEDFYTTEVNTENSVELRDNRYNQIIHMVSAANGAEDFYTTEVNTENSVELRDNRYNQIIHMVSAANGAEDFYTTENDELLSRLPKFLTLIKEVTGNPDYSMFNLSLKEEWHKKGGRYCTAWQQETSTQLSPSNGVKSNKAPVPPTAETNNNTPNGIGPKSAPTETGPKATPTKSELSNSTDPKSNPTDPKSNTEGPNEESAPSGNPSEKDLRGTTPSGAPNGKMNGKTLTNGK